MGFESPSHWVILIIIAALLFGGYKKLPEMSRSVGRSLRIFKTEMKGMSEDDEAREAADKVKPPAAELQQTEPAVVPVTPTVPSVPSVVVPPVAVTPAVPPVAVPPATASPEVSTTPSE